MTSGFYVNLPMRQYHEGEGWRDIINVSGLKACRRNASEFRYLKDNPEPPPDLPPDLRCPITMGSVVHWLMLEPDVRPVDAGILELPKWDYRKTDDKKAWETLRNKHPWHTYARPNVVEKAEAIAKAALANNGISDVLAWPGGRELTVVWPMQSAKGRECLVKIRIDALPDMGDGVAMVDLKSCQDASADAFSKAIANYEYHVQAGAYMAVARECPDIPTPEGFVFLAVSTAEPYLPGKSAYYRLADDELAVGESRFRDLLDYYLDCKEAGVWPGLNDGKLTTIERPLWARKRASHE